MYREVATALLISAVAVIPALAQAPAQPAPVPAGAKAQAIDLQSIVAGLERAQLENRQHYRAYTMVREYKLFSGNEGQQQSDVVAQVSFVPPDQKNFTISKVIGASRGEKVVRKILEHEVKTAKGDHGSSLLNRENYSFIYLGMATIEGHSCYALQLQPRQKREDMIAGRVWVDTETYLPRLIDGDLAKNPSWWLKRVHLTLSFANVDGMWLQTGTKAIADVRVFGEHTLTSQELNYQNRPAEARNRPPAANRRRARTPDLLGAGVFAH